NRSARCRNGILRKHWDRPETAYRLPFWKWPTSRVEGIEGRADRDASTAARECGRGEDRPRRVHAMYGKSAKDGAAGTAGGGSRFALAAARPPPRLRRYGAFTSPRVVL